MGKEGKVSHGTSRRIEAALSKPLRWNRLMSKNAKSAAGHNLDNEEQQGVVPTCFTVFVALEKAPPPCLAGLTPSTGLGLTGGRAEWSRARTHSARWCRKRGAPRRRAPGGRSPRASCDEGSTDALRENGKNQLVIHFVLFGDEDFQPRCWLSPHRVTRRRHPPCRLLLYA